MASSYARTISGLLIFPEATITTVFLHDVVEDYPVKISEIETLFGGDIAAAVNRISKVVEQHKKPSEDYFNDLALCPIASVAKGIDRIHNHQTMRKAFKPSKQIDYLGETEDDILPMLKLARRRFPEQEPAYENIKHMLITQMELYAHTLEKKYRDRLTSLQLSTPGMQGCPVINSGISQHAPLQHENQVTPSCWLSCLWSRHAPYRRHS